LRARFIFLVHTDLSPASLSGSKLALNRHVARRADAVIVHGPFLRDKLLKLGCAADCLLEFDTGFDPSALIDVTRNSTKPPCKTDAFLYAGRIEANKGVFDLLNAFESIAADSEVRLVFAGEGGDLKGLRQQAAASIYSDRIAVLGAVAHAELLQMMQAALATVTPTQSRFPEGRCMSAMESLLVGTPVIAPEYGPFPYLVNHCENGLLYAPDRVPSLAAAMRRLINEPGLSVQLQSGAARSGAELMTPRHSFVSRLLEASR
jgi:glycosyltransferase involved in cell wall biosynthesis